MDGGLAPDIIASIVEKVQIPILMNLGHFIADGFWYDNALVSYSYVGAHLDYGILCGCWCLSWLGVPSLGYVFLGASLSY